MTRRATRAGTTSSDVDRARLRRRDPGGLARRDRRPRARLRPRSGSLNEAAEVLLDPERRAAYDAELGRARAASRAETRARSTTGRARRRRRTRAGRERRGEPVPSAARRRPASPPGCWPWPGWCSSRWSRGCALGVAVHLRRRRPQVEATPARRQAAAERAIVPILSYDYETLEADQAARAGLPHRPTTARTTTELFDGHLPRTRRRPRPSVEAEVVGVGVVRSGEDRGRRARLRRPAHDQQGHSRSPRPTRTRSPSPWRRSTASGWSTTSTAGDPGRPRRDRRASPRRRGSASERWRRLRRHRCAAVRGSIVRPAGRGA